MDTKRFQFLIGKVWPKLSFILDSEYGALAVSIPYR